MSPSRWTWQGGLGILAWLAALGLAACSSAGDDGADVPEVAPVDASGETAGAEADVPAAPAYPLDDVLRVNQLQAGGTHNSYHVRPDFRNVVAEWDYTLAPLDVQLGPQGVRHLELDLHWLATGGFGVYHLPALDMGSTCGTLDNCLGLVRAWSDAHPGHHLITLMLEPKDDADALKLDDHYADLESVLLDTLSRSTLLVPDDVRGAHTTLREALEAEGWPTLGATRGKVMVILNDETHAREVYLAGDVTLAGRVMFVRGGLDEPFGAFLEYGDPVSDEAAITAGVQAGYLVRTSAVSSGNDDQKALAWREAALRSGAHWIASDFPAPVEGHAVWLEIPGGTPSRCNPITAATGCTSEDREALAHKTFHRPFAP